MLNILTHTPVWVYVLFAGLLALGLHQTRDRWVHRGKAFVAPLAFWAFSAFSMQSNFGWSVWPTAVWGLSLVVVAMLGGTALKHSKLRFDVQRQQFFIPGSWLPLTVILLIFFMKYALAVVEAREDVTLSTGPTLLLGALLGSCSGYFAARTLAMANVAKRAMNLPAAPP